MEIKKDDIGYGDDKKVKGLKISALVYPLSIVISSANAHDSKFYLLTIMNVPVNKRNRKIEESDEL